MKEQRSEYGRSAKNVLNNFYYVSKRNGHSIVVIVKNTESEYSSCGLLLDITQVIHIEKEKISKTINVVITNGIRKVLFDSDFFVYVNTKSRFSILVYKAKNECCDESLL